MLVCINISIRYLDVFRSKVEMYLRRKDGWIILKRGSSMNKEIELDLIYYVSREVNEVVGYIGLELF